MSDDVVEEFEVVVAGNAEDFGDAEFNQAVEQVVTDGVGGFSHPVDATRLRSKTPFARRRLAIVRAMAINETREIVIEATPTEILDVIADLESLTEWSPPHQSSEVLERHRDGRPSKAKMKVKAAGITDEQVVAYTWSDNKVSWTLVSSGQQRSQDASYTLTPDGDATLVKFEISVDPVVPLPGFVLKRAVKGTIDTGTKGLRDRVLQVKKGKA
jgi:ribosome-associated toxin RatA of RatAB toxin-antitoxin module